MTKHSVYDPDTGVKTGEVEIPGVQIPIGDPIQGALGFLLLIPILSIGYTVVAEYWQIGKAALKGDWKSALGNGNWILVALVLWWLLGVPCVLAGIAVLYTIFWK